MIRLPPKEYAKIMESLGSAPFNTLFARTVAEGRISGAVFVDDPRGPGTCLILHPYGMSLLVGNPGNTEFNAWLRGHMLNSHGNRRKPEWMQAHPVTWNPVIEGLLGPNLVAEAAAPNPDSKGKVVELTRVNFSFNEAIFREYLGRFRPMPPNIVSTTAEMFHAIEGQVVPKYFWRDAEHFADEGAGFSMRVNGVPVSTAFSAFVAPGMLELGIETAEGHRGRGYAEAVCRALIVHCLDNGLEPVWSCRLENRASMSMAQKLGFQPVRHIPYYSLPLGQASSAGP